MVTMKSNVISRAISIARSLLRESKATTCPSMNPCNVKGFGNKYILIARAQRTWGGQIEGVTYTSYGYERGRRCSFRWTDDIDILPILE